MLLVAPLLAFGSLPPPGEVAWGPWYELRPFEHPPGAPSVAGELDLERELGLMRPGGPGPSLTRDFFGKKRIGIEWRESEARATAEDPLGDQVALDLARGLAPEMRENAVAYLYRTIDAPADQTSWVLLGSDDGMRLWLNGELLLDVPVARPLREGEERLLLPLRAGRNHLLVKVGNLGSAWGFQLIHDPERMIALRYEAEVAINRAIDRGVEYLLSTQYPDGSWNYMTHEYRNGQTALAVYTLLKSGLAPGSDPVQRGIRYLRSRLPRHTYSAACELMAFGATKDPGLHPDMAAIVELLVDWQMGGFSYPQGAVDLSNTQYAALGLRAAALAGLSVRSKVWSDLAEHVLSFQHADGGFGYQRESPPTGSMTAGGLTVLGACHEALAENDAMAGRVKRIEAALEAGVEWLRRRWSVRTNPQGDDRWVPYYLYGLERVGALLGTARIGPHDWYWDGAQVLLPLQGGSGEWSTAWGEAEPNTCFALLFLERATAAVSGVAQRTRARSYGADDPAAPVSLRAAGDTPLTVWISSFGEETLRAWAWPAERGGGLRVVRVEYLVGGEVVETVPGNPSRPPGLERWAAQLRFPAAGSYTLGARVVLTTAPPETREVVLETAPITVEIRDLVDEETIAYATDSTKNLLTDAAFTTGASSAADGHPPALAADDRLSTCWLSADQEGAAIWVLEMKRAVRADTVLVTQARPVARDPAHAARFTRIEVVVNRRAKSSIVVEATPDIARKTEIPLGRPEIIRHLEIRILELVPGEKLAHAAGFAEVELQLRR
ncbi:MAG: hypothetical protein AB1726_08885 [Planctomycetota bacterium]